MKPRLKPVVQVMSIALGGLVFVTASAQQAAKVQDLERVEVTGSRIKRTDVEGALPVTVITRDELEASGATTAAEFVRTLPFASTGNFRPQSGSSAQSFAGIDLRGLGENRTLVLIDGRRVSKGPMVGDSVDLNIIPMAMIERVEILTDGASAIYGSDAIAGVVNFITRRKFEGIELMGGATRLSVEGGDRGEAHAMFGTSNDKGHLLGGISWSKRNIIYQKDRPWDVPRGASVFGNNYTTGTRNDKGEWSSNFDFTSIPGGCNEPNFYLRGASCRYDFTQVAADEAEIEATSLFLKGEYKITENWDGYLNAMVGRVESFGRYAPTPARNIFLAADNPFNPAPGKEVELFHRFASAGPRDTNTDNNYYAFILGARGTIGDVDVDAGYRRSDSQYYELGRNYIVSALAQKFIADGSYDLKNPSANDPTVLNSIKATINRDARFLEEEVFGNATFTLFNMPGGASRLNVGAEYRKETFKDQYDSLQEAGLIEGSAGNSSGGDRNVTSLFGELLLPITRDLEASLSVRWEDYSDYGSDLAPKASVRWKAMPNLLFRASIGQGFRAPSIPILTQKTTFSAESVVDPRSCIVLNPGLEDCQVNTYFIANPELDSEKSDQWSLGVVWDPTPWLSLKLDYWNVEITDQIVQIGAQTLVDRDNGTDPKPIPPGLGVARNSIGVITRIDAGYANEGDLKTDGIDLSVAGNFSLAQYGLLRSEIRYTRVFSYEEGGFDFSGSIGQPEDRGMWINSWKMGPFAAQWNINYIGRNEFQPNSNDTRSVGSYVTHDVQFSWEPPLLRGGQVVIGAVNVFEKLPVLVNFEGRPFNFNLYDAYGRQVYVRYTQRF